MAPDILVMTQDTLTYKLLVSKGRLRPEKVDCLSFGQDDETRRVPGTFLRASGRRILSHLCTDLN